MKDYSKFYTPRMVARLLIKNCKIEDPKNAIDICAGSWNLLNEAKSKWPNIELVGVDIQKHNEQGFVEDGRCFSFQAFQKKQLFDLVLANPPFEYEKVPLEIRKMIDIAFPFHQFNGNILNRLESTMLLFNSLLVKDNGYLASVVPNSLLFAENQNSLRSYFASNFHLEKIIHLPDSAFGKQNIRTSLVLLRKKVTKKPTRIYNAAERNNQYIANHAGSIPHTKITKGKWDLLDSNKDIKVDDLKIIRNNISTNMLSTNKLGHPVIHNGTIANGNLKLEKIRFLNEAIPRMEYVEPGDIVINRVGKSIGQFALINDEEKKYLSSDCVLIIRPANQETRNLLINKLNSTNFKEFKKGVTTKYITKNDIYKLMIL